MDEFDNRYSQISPRFTLNDFFGSCRQLDHTWLESKDGSRKISSFVTKLNIPRDLEKLTKLLHLFQSDSSSTASACP